MSGDLSREMRRVLMHLAQGAIVQRDAGFSGARMVTRDGSAYILGRTIEALDRRGLVLREDKSYGGYVTSASRWRLTEPGEIVASALLAEREARLTTSPSC